MTGRRIVTVLLSIFAASGVMAADLYADYDQLLGAVVEGELVDYIAIRDRHGETLDSVLEGFADVDPAGLMPEERLAFLINLYNASMIEAVTSMKLPGASPSDNGFAVFKEKRVRYRGARISLDHLEHQLIRPVFNEPRVHVALVCAARSCPPILDRAWRGADLEATLDARMRAFVNDRTRNRIDRRAKKLELSQIFEWFADDFGGRARLAAYVDRYTEVDTTGWPVSFVEYGWELNITP